MIKAPFDGVVGLRKVSVGDFVNVGQDMVNLEQIDPLKADFRVAELYLAAVRTGQRIELRVDAFPDETFTGAVYAIDPLIDESGRSIVLRARLPNQDGRLRPGLFARVTLVLNERDDAIQVPEQALVPQGQEQFVFRVVDGKAALTKVEVGIRREGMVEIVEGLGPEDEVVTAGQLKIRDGAPVQPLPDAEA
jgi:membrane fusion protein (multidrug efflux system)